MFTPSEILKPQTQDVLMAAPSHQIEIFLKSCASFYNRFTKIIIRISNRIKFCWFWQWDFIDWPIIRVSGFKRFKISLITYIITESDRWRSYRREQTHGWDKATMQLQRCCGANGEADREMEIKWGEPTAGQKSSNATAVEWQWERREYESYTNPSLSPSLSLSLPPSPPYQPPRLQCRCSRVALILTHSFTAESPTFVIQMKSSYLRDHRSSHYSALTYFPALAARVPFMKCSILEYVQRKAHTHTHIFNP